MKKLILFMVFTATFGAFAAQAPTPAFMHPEVLKAASAINLTDAQKPQFRQAITTFYNERIRAINLLLRRHNQSNVPRKIKGKTNALLKNMDKEMAEFLSEEQMAAYKNYRKALKSNMQGM